MTHPDIRVFCQIYFGGVLDIMVQAYKWLLGIENFHSIRKSTAFGQYCRSVVMCHDSMWTNRDDISAPCRCCCHVMLLCNFLNEC
eukprot:gene1586-biopygen11001